MIWKNTSTLDHFLPETAINPTPHLATLAIVGASEFDLEEMPNLKAVFRCGVGTDNIDFEACAERGIQVALPSQKSQNIIFEETANFAVKCILDGLYRWQGDIDDWSKKDRAGLKSRQVLLLGQGNIGRRVRQKLAPLVTVNSWDPAIDSAKQLEPSLNEAEVVSLHMPLNVKTRGWFDADMLNNLKDGSVIVNTARGPIVDELDLLREIKSGRLRAIFDVFWREPYQGPLKEYHPSRFVMSPHIASHCKEFVESLAADFRNLAASMGFELA